jgi:sugar O-acyltransferase (sialic acid O-acetyltransferase NeuD family)
MPNILLVGARGHAKVIIDIIEAVGVHRVVGLLDLDTPVGATVLGYPLLGRPSDIAEVAHRTGATHAVAAIGDNVARARVTAHLRAAVPSLDLPTVIHPTAVIGRDVRLGAGTVVMAGAIINPCCTLGEGCVVNTGARLDHDCTLGDFASLAPGVVTGGDCHLGDGASVGIGATIVQQVRIGEGAMIGAGATVLSDIPPRMVAVGTPARVTRPV